MKFKPVYLIFSLVFILSFFVLPMAYSQKVKTIEGVVIDAATGEVLIGAVIALKNTTSGVTTNYDGHYTFGNIVSHSVLEVSFMGYETQTIIVGERSIIDVQLEPSTLDLEAVVVFGENQKDLRGVTGSVSKIDTRVFSAGTPATSFDQLLQGQVAGLSIVTNGEPGEKTKIRIRGNNSLGIRSSDEVDVLTSNLANEPLYILNGVPINSDVFNTINPDDIVDIRVLKDALSTVEYGTRGANGVIEIKTKRGISGQKQYNIRYQHSVKPIMGLGGIDLMKSDEKLRMESELEVVNGLGYIYTPQLGDSDEEILIKEKRYRQLQGINTNWLHELSRVAHVDDFQFSFSGGVHDTRYYVSANYYSEQGSYKQSWSDRFSTRFNLDHNINEDVTLGFDASIGRSQRSKSATSPAGLIYTLQPYEQVDASNFIARDPLTNGSHYFETPFDELKNRYSENGTWRADLNVRLNWILKKDLSVNASIGLAYNDSENDVVTMPNKVTNAAGLIKGKGAFSKGQSKLLTHRVNLGIEYRKYIENHSIAVMTGTEYIHNNNHGYGFNSIGISDKVDPEVGANPDATISINKYNDALLGFYFRANYNYDSRYILTGSIRYDGSSILPIDKQFVPAFGIGAAWSIDEENWYNIDYIVDNVKVRASYGINYNSGGIRQTLGLPFYDFTNNNTYMGYRVINLVEFWNPDLSFERAKQWSVAIDFSLFERKVYGTLEGYIKNTDDLLATVDIPSSNGHTSLLRNIGQLQNKGFELELNAVPIRTSNFRWTSILNIAYNKNKITKLYEQDEIKVGSDGYYKVGEAINSAYVKHWAGVLSVNGSPLYYDENKNLVNGGVAPQKIGFGTYDHPMTGGFTNVFSYGHFELSALFTFAWGGVAYNQLKAQMIRNVKNGEIPYAGFYDDIWLNKGDNKPLPNPKYFSDTSSNSLFVENASYIRIKNIILRYNLGENLNWKKFKSVKLTAQMNNLYTITGFTGIDPEVTGVGQALPRSFTIGFDVTL